MSFAPKLPSGNVAVLRCALAALVVADLAVLSIRKLLAAELRRWADVERRCEAAATAFCAARASCLCALLSSLIAADQTEEHAKRAGCAVRERGRLSERAQQHEHSGARAVAPGLHVPCVYGCASA